MNSCDIARARVWTNPYRREARHMMYRGSICPDYSYELPCQVKQYTYYARASTCTLSWLYRLYTAKNESRNSRYALTIRDSSLLSPQAGKPRMRLRVLKRRRHTLRALPQRHEYAIKVLFILTESIFIVAYPPRHIEFRRNHLIHIGLRMRRVY